MKHRRTTKLETGVRVAIRRAAATRAAARRRRCDVCGAWLNVQGECRACAYRG